MAFLILVVDFIGFGILIPILPYLAKHFGSSSFVLGCLMSSFSLVQFLFSPFWGSLSDFIGRRPVLLITLLGTCFSHLLFAFSFHIVVLFIARSLNGFFGANVSTVQAMIADLTKEKERSKNMGIIGAAIGLGFFLGPFLGGVLVDLGAKLTFLPNSSFSLPALVSASLSFVSFLIGYFTLTETYKSPKKNKKFSLNFQPFLKRINHIHDYLFKPLINKLFVIQCLFHTCFSCMEVAFFLFIMDVLILDVVTASFGFAYVGFVIIITNAFLVRWLIPFFGEKVNIVLGLSLGILSFGLLGFSTKIFPDLVVALTLVGLSGLLMPSVMGTISILSSKDRQGEALGVNQSMASIGRILGPLLGGILYESFASSTPFFISSFLTMISLMVFLKDFRKWPSRGKS